MTKSRINGLFAKEKTVKKNFPLYVSNWQKKKLSEIWLSSSIFATDIISKGVDRYDDIGSLPKSEGPFSEKFTLKVEPELIKRLDYLSEKINCSRAEIVRRIFDKAIKAWDQEEENLRKVQRPFSAVFRGFGKSDDDQP